MGKHHKTVFRALTTSEIRLLWLFSCLAGVRERLYSLVASVQTEVTLTLVQANSTFRRDVYLSVDCLVH